MIDGSMRLPNSICSTLAILISFSRLPSIASCVVTAAGSDFMAILLLIFVDSAACGASPSPVSVFWVSPTCILDSSSGIDLFCPRSPLLLAVNGVDFMIGFSPAGPAAGFVVGPVVAAVADAVAGSVPGAAAVVLSLLFFALLFVPHHPMSH